MERNSYRTMKMKAKRKAPLSRKLAICLLVLPFSLIIFGFFVIEIILSPHGHTNTNVQEPWKRQSVSVVSNTNHDSALWGNEMQNNRRTPVVIVPGAMGSLLEAKLDKKTAVSNVCSLKSNWYTLWISEWALAFPSCFFDNIKMVYLGEGKVKNVDGVVTRVPHYGNSVDGIDCVVKYTQRLCESTKNWKSVIEHLEKTLGYQVGRDLFSAPYDFRRGPDDYMEYDYPNLKKLIESVYEANEMKPVVTMSISLGGMFLHTFFTHYVDQQWKNKYIKRWLSMAGLFNGFAQSFQNTFVGRNTFLDLKGIFQQTGVRDAYRSWFSAAWLIPKEIYGDNRVILKTPHQDYKISDIKDMLEGDQAAMYTRSYMYNMTADPGVPTDCWFTIKRRSQIAFVIQENMTSDLFYSEEPVTITKFVNGGGDGAADAKSLQLCDRWKSTTVRHFSICHGCYLYEAPALRAIEKLLIEVSAHSDQS